MDKEFVAHEIQKWAKRELQRFRAITEQLRAEAVQEIRLLMVRPCQLEEPEEVLSPEKLEVRNKVVLYLQQEIRLPDSDLELTGDGRDALNSAVKAGLFKKYVAASLAPAFSRVTGVVGSVVFRTDRCAAQCFLAPVPEFERYQKAYRDESDYLSQNVTSDIPF